MTYWETSCVLQTLFSAIEEDIIYERVSHSFCRYYIEPAEGAAATRTVQNTGNRPALSDVEETHLLAELSSGAGRRSACRWVKCGILGGLLVGTELRHVCKVQSHTIWTQQCISWSRGYLRSCCYSREKERKVIILQSAVYNNSNDNNNSSMSHQDVTMVLPVLQAAEVETFCLRELICRRHCVGQNGWFHLSRLSYRIWPSLCLVSALCWWQGLCSQGERCRM